MAFKPGQSLRGYLIREFVQAGGFGAIYKAHQDSIYRDVAIKVIENDRIVKNIDFIRRFEIEAQIIARLEHPHIVPIYDFWREPDHAFIVMRWLDSGNIRDRFSSQIFLDGKTVGTLISHISSALHFVHQHGIVHRDIKPDNILVDSGNNYYLTDFGIAIDMQHRAEIEVEFLRIGTPEYMSPEQILYDTVTYKSDIYAFAILIYEMLTYETPFMADNMDEVFLQHANMPFPSVRKLRPDLPYELDTVLAKAAEKSPDDRYDSILEFAQDLMPLVGTSAFPPIAIQPPNTSSSAIPETITLSKQPNVSDKTTETRIVEHGSIFNRNPYKGLKAFEETDARDFFGRDAIIRLMVSSLQKQLEQNQSSFIAVVGASGSGKSSVVRAGVIPYLRSGGLNQSNQWFYITMTPGENPITTLAEKLNSISLQGQDDFADILRTNAFDVARMIGDRVGQEHIVLLIDQFEEVFTQVENEAERKKFIDLLVRLSQSDLRISIILTLRADFYDKPLAYRELGELIQSSTFTVLPMSADELEQVILEPASSVNCIVQPSLVSQLIADTIHQPNALPLLQFTITALFENREDRLLTLREYEAMGRLQGSVAQRAETVLVSLSAHEQEIAQRLFLQLVILSDTNQSVRRRILWKDALQLAEPDEMEALINLFGKNRLLTFDRDPISRQPTIEVAHEALIQAWTRLQIWIAENRSVLMTYNRLASSVNEWLVNDQDTSFLVRDVQLLQYEEIAQNPVIKLTDDEKQYLSASQALRRRNQLLRYGVMMSLVLLTIVSFGVSVIAIDKQNQANLAEQVALGERDRANKESDISQSRALAATALNSRVGGRDALLMAIEANTIADTFEARDSLANILADHNWVERYYSQDVPIRNFMVSSDLQTVYTVGDSSQILRWDLNSSTFEILADLPIIPILNAIAINSDETKIAVGGEGGYALIDAVTGETLFNASRDADVWSLGWSLDGTVIYGVDSIGSVFAYQFASETMLFDLRVGSEALLDIALNPDGQSLAVGGANNVIMVLDVSSGDVLYEFEGHSNWVLSLAYSPDGRLLASGGADLNLIVWDMDDLKALGQIPTRHTDWIRHVEFNSDGTQMMTASADGTLKRWDVATGRQINETLSRHTSSVWSASYLTDDHLLSADRDGQLILWSLSPLHYPMIRSQQLDEQIIDVLAIDGVQKVAIATNQNDESASLLIMNLDTGEVIDELALPSFVTSMDYSEGQNLLAVAGVDQMIRLVDISNPIDLVELGGHDSIIPDVAFSSDGQTLISVDDSGTLMRWNISTRILLDELTIADSSGLSLVRYLDDVHFITASRTGGLTIWDGESLEQTHIVEDGHQGVVTDMVLTDDGLTLYSIGRDGLVLVWNTETWEMQAVFPHIHTDWILDVAILDARTLVTTGRDGTLILWDVDRQQPIGQPFTSAPSDWGLSILVDEPTLNAYSLYRDGQIMTWEFLMQDWLNYGCNVANIDAIPMTIQHLMDDIHYCIGS